MDNLFELTALRDSREIQLSIRELENQAAAVSKRYKRGIKMLELELNTIDRILDEGGSQIEGCEPWEVRSKEMKHLISVPVLVNIPEDNLV